MGICCSCCRCPGQSRSGHNCQGTSTAALIAPQQPAKPGQVQNLRVTVDPRRPTVTLAWDPPANGANDVTAYEYRCRKEERSAGLLDWISTSGRSPQTHSVSYLVTSVRLMKDHGVVPLTMCTFEVRAMIGTVEGYWKLERAFIDWKPDPVENFTVTQHNPKSPYVVLNWSPPINMGTEYIKGYDIRLKQRDNLNSYDYSSNFIMDRVGNTTTTMELTTPVVTALTTYAFEVRAYTDYSEGEWCRETKHIDWYCKLPGCNVNRELLTGGRISEFCSRKHSREYAAQYCLFPGCINKTRNDFCENHVEQAIQTGFSTVVDVDPDSRVFKDLCKHFRKDWAEAKGPCPDVNKGTILRIVNPAVSERFEKYRKGLPLFRRGLEHYYHGTKLKCRVDETLMFCKTTDCGVCGIAKRGFDPQKMGKSDVKFQRFGEGFYLAPNSSKSHDYTREYTSDTIHGILQCDVAPGKKHNLEQNARDLQGPPEGYHSVVGKHSRHGPLNYDEIVLHNPAAIRPCYILLYSTLQYYTV